MPGSLLYHARPAETMSKVVDGLRGGTFIIAKEVGLDNLWYVGSIGTVMLDDMGDEIRTDYVPAGVDALIDAIRPSAFPLTT